MTAVMDQKAKTVSMNVIQGEFAISDDERVIMTTILGSCVATTLHDPVLGIGGMNHFLLPGEAASNASGVQYGVHAMELLINALLRRGASKSRLQAKLFGGAQVVKGLSAIGGRNAEFARQFLRDEGIPCTAESLGGDRARRIRYCPTTNHVRQLLLADNSLAPPVRPREKPQPAGGDMELF